MNSRLFIILFSAFCLFGVESFAQANADKKDKETKKLEEETGFVCSSKTTRKEGMGTRCAPAECWNKEETEIHCESTMTNSAHSTGAEGGFQKGPMPANCIEAVRLSCEEMFYRGKGKGGVEKDLLTEFGKRVKKDICKDKGNIVVIDEVWQAADKSLSRVEKALKDKKKKKVDLPTCKQIRGSGDKFNPDPKVMGKMCHTNSSYAEAPRTVWYKCSTENEDGETVEENGKIRFDNRKKKEFDRR